MPPFGWFLAALLIATTWASPASAAIRIENRGTEDLDGKVIMSPAAEPVETTIPDGGRMLEPGSTAHRTIVIHNRTSETITFDLNLAQIIGSTSEYVVEVRHGIREGSASWVRLDAESFTLRPGQQATIPLTIRIPRSAKPGSHPFGVSATQRSTGGQTGDKDIPPQYKQVAIFIVELPGDALMNIKAGLLRVRALYPDPDDISESDSAALAVRRGVHRIELDVHNGGQRLFKVSGEVSITKLLGPRISHDIRDTSVYPGGASLATTGDDPVELEDGIYVVRFQLESDAGPIDVTKLLFVS